MFGIVAALVFIEVCHVPLEFEIILAAIHAKVYFLAANFSYDCTHSVTVGGCNQPDIAV